jgi:hypothetical protein
MFNTSCLVTVLDLQRVVVDIDPVELRRVWLDGTDEPGRRWLFRSVVEVESRKGMSIAKLPFRLIGVIQIELDQGDGIRICTMKKSGADLEKTGIV